MEKLILRRVDRNYEEMVLNFGPQHPSTHGVINFIVETDGEVMKRAIPDVGYLHRSIEKIGEATGYPGFMPFTDRIDYVAAMFANEGYAIAVEKLLKVEVPPRAQWLRAISCELVRIASHLIAVGTMTMDIGAFTPMVHGLREREEINDFIEALCGARLTYNYHRIGGVAFDLPEGWRDKVLAFLDRFDKFLPEFDRLITFNEIYKKRLASVAVVSREQAIGYGLVGPNLRGSGVDWDLRRDMPYGAYPNFEFEVPVGKGWAGAVGDCFDRYYVRCLEMKESSRIVRQALETIGQTPEEIMAKVPRNVKPDAGEVLSRVESARGEMAYYVVSDGTNKAYRVRARTGSFTAMSIIEDISGGLMVADLVALISSLDVVAPEIDR
ncbi:MULTISPECIES: NADH-quinone oxidoreductase subunit D [unclassified Anaeromyxobacter]|uniref:NADH-quinone oxidoreductase subunit D n=1 Tax=unclassified Anaeromyxobacter TaxID=2620896 RepID=UPI001F58A85E|nr:MULTISPECIES: NADH-quinone oxidoreductase subunit D [unclassified Anaeromyxobacter]